MNFFHIKQLSNLIYFLPFLIVTGPFLPDLIVSITSVFFLIYIFYKKEFLFLYNIYFLLLISFNFHLIISSFFSDNIYFSLKTSIPYLRHTFFVFLVIYLIKKKYFSFKIFYYIFFITIVLVIFDGFFQYVLSYNILGFPISSSNRLSSFLNDEYILGSYLIRMLPIFLGILLLQQNINFNLKLILVNFFISTIGVLILLSGERSALFLFFVFCFILLILYKINFKFKIVSFIIIFIPIILILQNNLLIKDRMILQTFNTMTSELNLSKIVNSQYRYHFKSGIEMFMDSKIFGQGPKMYRNKCIEEKYFVNKFSCQTHPHNTYVQLLAEIGLIGTLFISITFMYLIFLLFKDFYFYYFKNKIYLNNSNLMFVSVAVLNFWPFITTGNFFNNWISIMYFFPFIFIINFLFKENDNH